MTRLLLILSSALWLFQANAAPDLVLRRAQIIDGLGKPAFTGDIAITGGRITAIGEVTERGAAELDLRGQVVAPGFIDVHTHSENLGDLPDAENFIRMGVTTIITGNCGGSRTDIAKFFADLEKRTIAPNVASLIGHNSVRIQVMGGSFMRPPHPDELRAMKALVDKGMRDGAVGLSTGLIYLPGTFAKTEEIIELAKMAAQHRGIYVSHMRAETVKIFSAIDELCRIAREAGLPAEVSHLKLSGPNAWGKANEVIARLDAARAEGLKITHDQYAYTASSTSLGTLIPDEAREGNSKDFAARLDDPEQKAKIVAEMKRTLKSGAREDYSYAVIASYKKDPALNGKNIVQAAKLRRGSESIDDQIEMILEIHRQGGAGAVFHGMSEPDLQTFLKHPLTMIASDGGPRHFGDGVPHPRSYGNNARVLGRYVRELKVLTLEDAVRKMSALPAATFQMNDRGTITTGKIADLVVFDPVTVNDPATFEDPHHYATGFTHVLVNGVPVIQDGKLTGKRPGKAYRHPAAP